MYIYICIYLQPEKLKLKLKVMYKSIKKRCMWNGEFTILLVICGRQNIEFNQVSVVQTTRMLQIMQNLF